MDEAQHRKIGANEALLREVNEAIERGVWPGEEQRSVRFRCECAELQCNQVVELTLRQYEAVRANARRFVLVDGHEVPEAESVVERQPGYIVVEKKRGEGGEVAEATDPRG